jgi:hypothetical protein
MHAGALVAAAKHPGVYKAVAFYPGGVGRYVAHTRGKRAARAKHADSGGGVTPYANRDGTAITVNRFLPTLVELESFYACHFFSFH